MNANKAVAAKKRQTMVEHTLIVVQFNWFQKGLAGFPKPAHSYRELFISGNWLGMLRELCKGCTSRGILKCDPVSVRRAKTGYLKKWVVRKRPISKFDNMIM
jgi:hypothetical protein